MFQGFPVCSLVFFLSVFLSGQGFADDVTKTIDQALKDYQAGHYAAAATNLDHASKLIRDKKANKLLQYFPKPLKGWESHEPKPQTAAAGMFGGVVMIEQNFTQAESTVVVRIITDSPMMTSLAGIMSNPMMMASPGMGARKIKGHQALIQPANLGMSINVIVGNRFLVQVEGEAVEEAILLKFAEGIDYDGLHSEAS
jgi:hypothetical protein